LNKLDYQLIELNREQINEIDERLEQFDNAHIKQDLSGGVQLGIVYNDKLVAGINAVITTFRIMYISTLWVDEGFRGKGLGKQLIEEMEARAVKMGVNTLRADTFDFQGVEFYLAIGFTEAGSYTNQEDGYSEHFFVKRI